jgi:hypothetical protein
MQGMSWLDREILLLKKGPAMQSWSASWSISYLLLRTKTGGPAS